MELTKLVSELNKVEEDIKELQLQLKILKIEKHKLWKQIMKNNEVRDIYLKSGEYMKKNLWELLKENGYGVE